MLDALQALARRLAGLGEGIDEREVGMRRELPGARRRGVRLARVSPFEARMRPAISAAGTSDGASRKASFASASALSGFDASSSRASAVSSTARRRSATSRHRSRRCWRAMASVSSAPSQSPARACKSNSALTPQASFGSRLHRPLGERRGPRRCRCRASPRGTGRARREARSRAGRAWPRRRAARAALSPLSWAAWALSSAVSGSFGRLRRAMPA